MGLLEFSKLPINTLVGADWKTFNQGGMPSAFYLKAAARQALRKIAC